jgi:hypothetical protein
MFPYSLSRSNTALSTTADWLTILANANRSLRIIELSFGGMATASAANEVMLMRSTSGATGSAAVAAVPLHSNAPAAAFTNFTAWVTQPTAGGVLLRIPVNANGGVYRWVARPGQEIIVPANTQVSIRSAVGASNVTGHVIVEEV